MKLGVPTSAVLTVAAITLAAISSARAQQPAISTSSDPTSGKSRTFLAGQIQVSSDFQAFENNAFSYTPVQPLRKGDVVVAMVSEDQAWSVDTAGNRQRRQDEKGYPPKGRSSPRDVTAALAEYPVAAMVKTSDGKSHNLYPAVLKAKTEMNAGSVVHSDGYQIEAVRSVRLGEPVPVLVVGNGILSIEVAPSPPAVAGSKPSFAAFREM